MLTILSTRESLMDIRHTTWSVGPTRPFLAAIAIASASMPSLLPSTLGADRMGMTPVGNANHWMLPQAP